MAVGTLDSRVEHLALDERTVDVVFVADLSIGEVDRFCERLECEVVVKIAAGFPRVVDGGAAGVAGGASLDLVQVVVGFEIDQAGAMIAIGKDSCVCHQFIVEAGGTVAGFAADIDFGP